ncbi:succinyl-CoA ligase [ADP-forming] subunit beta [bacterium BMS3Bbin12]|nr:succinyl-CoA ligase [ADP-forming] subunit beta [bacterium BMS3Abin12]GBE47140.1 succinyl-CoA ligase [ADP-forming] subunit beta [bacterium BMS3Bbin12]GBE49539.1 succinyl-CoA ligase [ADP-forming] subunit beta [bacterium BMS3Bbin13]HDK02739.1 ADP-forming succinate--CoA ligase subunit beta [Gammaproteobacteria bacterium]
MHLHEYQGKALLAQIGFPVPPGRVVRSPGEAVRAASELPGAAWLVKAQVHSGGRGKAGGVRRADSPEEVGRVARELLGTRLVTAQSGGRGLPVEAVLVEQPASLVRELYLAMLVDRRRERVAVLGARSGGMEIEALAAEDPGAVCSVSVDPAAGLLPYQCRRLAFALGLDAEAAAALGRRLPSLYRLFVERDLSLLEINPLGITDSGGPVAVDVKIQVDDNALYRQPALAAQADPGQEEELERAARQFGLHYIRLDGDIACMVNGAGLAMGTMDLIKLQGGNPANFLDVGGGTTAERVAEAFKLILSDPKVRAILVNIFGGIVRCDLIAEGIIQAVREVRVTVPVVVRLEGTNAALGRQLLSESGLDLMGADDFTEAARKAVAAAGGGPAR